MNQIKSVKGITREYRKACRAASIRGFFLRGPFHVRSFFSGEVILPAKMSSTTDAEFVRGPAPLSTPKQEKLNPLPTSGFPAENLPTVFKRVIREAKTENDKRRIDYRKIPNPKPGQMVWVKLLQTNGKMKWTETEYGAKLTEMKVA